MNPYEEIAEWLAEVSFRDDDGYPTLTDDVRKHLVRDGGSYRHVIFDNDVVYKLNHYGHEDRTNRSEWENYWDLPEGLRPLFATPLYLSEDGSVIVIERLASILDDHNPDGMCIAEVDDYFQSAFRECGIEDAHSWLWDLSYRNVGHKRDGTLAILDYAR